MSYVSWRSNNEDKYVDMIDNGETEDIPAFMESSKNDASVTVAGYVVDQLLARKDMTPVHFAGVFSQYLYETYHVSPIDIEIFSQYITLSEIKNRESLSIEAAKAGATTVLELFENMYDKDEEEDE